MQFLYYHFRPGTVLLIMVFASSFAMAQSVPIDIDFQKIKNQMIAERQIQVLEPMRVATRELNTKYVAALDRLLQNSAQVMKSDLLAIREERSRVSKGESMPPIDFDGTPAVLKSLRQAYRRSLTGLRKDAENAWQVVRAKALKAHAALQMQFVQSAATTGQLRQVPTLPDFFSGVIVWEEALFFPLEGKWKVYRSTGVVDEWTATGDSKYSMEVRYSKGRAFCKQHAGGFHVVDYLSETEDWHIKVTSPGVFEGVHAKDSRIKIYGERTQP